MKLRSSLAVMLIVLTAAAASDAQLVSSSSDLTPTDSGSEASLSRDGLTVAFTKVEGSQSRVVAISYPFAPSTAVQVSVSSAGAGANGSSTEPSISADGRFVAFTSRATNLVAPVRTASCGGGTGSTARRAVYIRDVASGTTDLIAPATSGSCSPYRLAESWAPSISADGRFVAFVSDAADLVADDTNGHRDAFVFDRLTGFTQRISVASSGAQASDATFEVELAPDGLSAAFTSWASNLVPGDVNLAHDVFVRDFVTHATVRVSVSDSGSGGNQGSLQPSISEDGGLIAFVSLASNLVGGDANGVADVFIRDVERDLTTLASVGTNRMQGSHPSLHPSMSADGRYVAFASASNFATDVNRLQNSAKHDIFVRDRETGLTTLISRTSAIAGGQSLPGDSLQPSISSSDTGIFVAFTSFTLKGSPHVYVRRGPCLNEFQYPLLPMLCYPD